MKVRLGIFLLVIFAVLLFSCEKNIETSEENNNEQFFEHELTDNNENNENKLSSGNLGESFPVETMLNPYGYIPEFIPYVKVLPYEYDGYWSMKFSEYFKIDDGNKDVRNKMDMRL
jgi:hypothetical protein